jgi:hypothetical protein
MSARNCTSGPFETSLDGRVALEDLDVEVSPAVTPHGAYGRLSPLVNDLKLLFAALGAGNSVVPMGDNQRAVRLLAGYAASLRDH